MRNIEFTTRQLELESEYQYLAKVYEQNKNKKDKERQYPADYKERTLKLLEKYYELHLSQKTGTVIFLGIKDFFEAINPLLEFAENIVNNNEWSEYEYIGFGGDRYKLFVVGQALQKIGLPKDRVEELSKRIHKNIVENSKHSSVSVMFLECLSDQKDQRTHKLLQDYLKKEVNFYTTTFESIIKYKDKSDLALIEPYTHGVHVQKGDPRGTNSELIKTAMSAFKKLERLVK